MDLQAALRARLLANSTISGLVTKIAWGGLPQSSNLNYIRLTKAGAGRAWTHSGPDPLINPRAQIDMFGLNERDLGPLAAAVQAEMERTDRVTFGGWQFEPPALIENDIWPGPEDMTSGGQVYRVTHDYSFWARPA